MELITLYGSCSCTDIHRCWGKDKPRPRRHTGKWKKTPPVPFEDSNQTKMVAIGAEDSGRHGKMNEVLYASTTSQSYNSKSNAIRRKRETSNQFSS